MMARSRAPDFVSGDDLRQLTREEQVHFMGVGGAGMCALAELVARSGGRVSGCDLRPGPSTDRLRAMDVTIRAGHEPEHLEGSGALVVSAAVPADHPEIQEARSRGIPVLKRAEALGLWVNSGRVLAIAGTHGKTSTAAMATEILTEAGLDPTGLVGGRVPGSEGLNDEFLFGAPPWVSYEHMPDAPPPAPHGEVELQRDSVRRDTLRLRPTAAVPGIGESIR